MLFIIKKIVARALFPLTVCSALLAAGLWLLWFSKRQRAGKVLVTAGALALAVLSNGCVADQLLGPLESVYPPLLDPPAVAGDPPRHVRWVVVLNGGFARDPRLPASAWPGGVTLARLAEGARVQRRLTGSRLVFAVAGGDHPAGGLPAALAGLVGLPERDLLLVAGARDTEDEAEHVRSVAGDGPVVLVTSASHMARAMRVFRARGLTAVPAPADYKVVAGGEANPAAFYPSAEALANSERAVYEYLGLAWFWLRH